MAWKFYLRWAVLALAILVVGWYLTQRIQHRRRRLLVRCVLVAIAITPFPLWIPGEGGIIIPAAMLWCSRDHWLQWALRAAVPIGVLSGAMFVMASWLLREK